MACSSMRPWRPVSRLRPMSRRHAACSTCLARRSRLSGVSAVSCHVTVTVHSARRASGPVDVRSGSRARDRERLAHPAARQRQDQPTRLHILRPAHALTRVAPRALCPLRSLCTLALAAHPPRDPTISHSHRRLHSPGLLPSNRGPPRPSAAERASRTRIARWLHAEIGTSARYLTSTNYRDIGYRFNIQPERINEIC